MTETRVDFTDPWAERNLAEMQLRLRRVGGNEEEVAEFSEQWLHDPEWPHEDKQRVFALGDPRLRRELEDTRAGNRRDRETEVEEVEREQQELEDEAEFARVASLNADAAEIAQGSVAQVLTWVAGDVDRARASLDHERATVNPRKTLMRQLEDLLR